MVDFNISISGIRAALFREDVSANNIANINTPAFKSSRVDQVDIASGGTRIADVNINFSQGPLELADGRFSLAIQGDGFFAVSTPQGMRFTRAGSFNIDANGNVVTAEGYQLSPNIRVSTDARSIMVSPDGTVSATMPDGTVNTVAQIQLARFNNPGGLKLEGSNLTSQSSASGDPIFGNAGDGAFGSLVFGALEGSNVDLAGELVSQIINSAAVKANVGVIKTQNEMLGDILDMVG